MGTAHLPKTFYGKNRDAERHRRAAPRHTRSPRPQDAELGLDPRLRHRALDSTRHRRRAAYRGRVALSRAPSTREARLDRLRVGSLREQSPREVLQAHAAWTPAAP